MTRTILPGPAPEVEINQEARARKLHRLATIAEGLRSAAAASPADAALQSRLSVAGTACQQLVAHLRREDAPMRRCDDCRLNLGRDVLRALGTCPRWGMPRTGVESRCPAFVANCIDQLSGQPTVETLLILAQLLLEDARAAAEFGDPATHGLQRQAREIIGAALDRCAAVSS